MSVLYLPQPLIGYLGVTFGVDHATAAWSATAVQLGYAIGVLFFVPLGEIRRPRKIVLGQLVVTSFLLGMCAIAPKLWMLCLVLLAAGAGAAVVQLLSPLAARLAPSRQAQSNATAIIIAGMVVGIFGARFWSVIVAEQFGWRWVFSGIAVLTLIMVVVMRMVLPPGISPTQDGSYLDLLGSLTGLLKRSDILPWACAYQFLAFGAFNAIWTVGSLHLSDQFGLDAVEVGTFSLIGLIAAVVVPITGPTVTRFGHGKVRMAGFVPGIIGSLALVIFPANPVAVAAGMGGVALMNFVVQVPNQISIFSSLESASPRGNAIFIFFTFVGGAAGAQSGAILYQAGTIVATATLALCLSSGGLLTVSSRDIWRKRKSDLP